MAVLCQDSIKKMLAIIRDAMKWISIKDEMPQEGQEVLLYETNANSAGGSDIIIGYVKKHKVIDWQWFSSGGCCTNVYGEITHWMPLPAKP